MPSRLSLFHKKGLALRRAFFVFASGWIGLGTATAQVPLAKPDQSVPSLNQPRSLPSEQPQQPSRQGTAAVATTVSMDVLDETRKISRGDVLNFRIIEDQDPPVSLVVNDSGDLEAPYVGRVRAEGKTPRQLAFELKTLLEREYYHRATVILGLDMIGTRSPGRYYISGAVRSIGPMEIPPNEEFTVSKAILRAGGFSDFANQRKVKLTRQQPDGSTKTFEVDVKEVIERGRHEKDMEVLPNDSILVTERLINF